MELCIPPAGPGMAVTTYVSIWGLAGPGLDNGNVLGLNKGVVWRQQSRSLRVLSSNQRWILPSPACFKSLFPWASPGFAGAKELFGDKWALGSF